MKRPRTLFVVFVIICSMIFMGSLYGAPDGQRSAKFSEKHLRMIEASLVNALENPSPAVQASAAKVLKEIKAYASQYSFSRTIIPLMRILKDDEADLQARLSAAVALHVLGSGRGDFAISREALFTDVPRVKTLCSWLTHQRRHVE